MWNKKCSLPHSFSGQDLGVALPGAWRLTVSPKTAVKALATVKAGSYWGSLADDQLHQAWGVKRGTAAFSPHTRVPGKRAQEKAPRMGPRASCNLISAAHPSYGFHHVLSVRRQSVQPTADGETCTVIDPRRRRSLVAISESWRLSTTQHATCHGSLKHPGVAGFIRKTRCPLLIQKKIPARRN